MEFTRINNTANGNPRYVTHFLNIPIDGEGLTIDEKYSQAVKKANKIGGRRYHTKKYGGGIVFQSYNIEGLKEKINNL